jgi:phosphate transport system substrate-binding protein
VKYKTLPRATAFGAVALTVALGMSACSASNEDNSSSGDSTSTGGASLSGELNGAGATSQEAAMAAWKAGFQGQNPDTTVNYDAVGSGGGREQFLAGGVLFAGSDSAMEDEELAKAQDTCSGDAIEYPVYVSPIAVIYNVEGIDDLQLSPQVMTQIFDGKITNWSDATIAADNPDADLPDTDITPVHRSDESGTTANFTDYMSQVDAAGWPYDPDDVWPIKSGEAADGTSGVVSAVEGGDGTIGYADASQAGELGKAKIKVGSEYVEPSAEAASAVLDESEPAANASATNIAIEVNRTTTASGVYPIVLVSYHIDCSNYDSQEKADLVKGFESYVISEEGQQAAAEQAGSAPITDSLREQAQAAIDKIAATS